MASADREDLSLHIEIVQMQMQQALQLLPLLSALIELQKWLNRPRLPSERQLRWAHSYWREIHRSELEFRAAFPDWK